MVLDQLAGTDADRAQVAVEAAMLEGMHRLFPDASTVGLVEIRAGANGAAAK